MYLVLKIVDNTIYGDNLSHCACDAKSSYPLPTIPMAVIPSTPAIVAKAIQPVHRYQ